MLTLKKFRKFTIWITLKDDLLGIGGTGEFLCIPAKALTHSEEADSLFMVGQKTGLKAVQTSAPTTKSSSNIYNVQMD